MYRKHCTNRTHRLRSTLKMTHGKGREYKKLPPLNPETMKDNQYAYLISESYHRSDEVTLAFNCSYSKRNEHGPIRKNSTRLLYNLRTQLHLPNYDTAQLVVSGVRYIGLQNFFLIARRSTPRTISVRTIWWK